MFANTSVTTGSINASGGSTAGAPGSLTINNPYAAGAISLGDVTITGTNTPRSFQGFTAATDSTFSAGQVRTSGPINILSYNNQQFTSINTSSATASGGDVILNSYFGALSVTGATGIVTSGTGTGNASGKVEVYIPSGSVSVTGPITTTATAGATAGSVAVTGTTFSTAGAINTSNLGTIGNGADVSIFTTGNLTTTAVSANSGTTLGNGGGINLIAGSSGTGNVSAGAISATATGAGAPGGNVLITAPGTASVGNVTLSTTGTGTGGSLMIVAGTTGTSLAPAQTGTLTVGAVNTTSVLNGGEIVLANLGTGGAIVAGNLTTNPSGTDGQAGSIGIVSGGTVVIGNVLGSSVGGSGGADAYGADLFISAGATSGVSIRTGNIDLDATGPAGKLGGNIYFVRTAGATAATGSVTQKGAPAGSFFNGAPTAPVANIAGNTTLTFNGSSVTGYNPGGFTSITGGTVTVNATSGGTGDFRLLVPIVARGGDVTLTGLVGQTTGGFATPVIVLASGNITLTGNTTSSSTTAQGGVVNIISTAGATSLRTVDVSGTTGGQILLSGNVGPSSTGVSLANGASLLANSLASAGAGGRINIIAGGNVFLGTGDNRTNNSVNASGLSGGNITVVSGQSILDFETSIQATGTTGAGGNIWLQAVNGGVYLYNESIAGINYNANLDVSSTGSQGGSIYAAGPQGLSVRSDYISGAPASTTGSFNANGFRAGGTIALSSSQWAITLSDLSSITATASAVGGIGGVVQMSTAGTLQTSSVNVSGSFGGTIQGSSLFYILDNGGNLSANGTAGSGGLIRIATAYAARLGSSQNTTSNSISANGTSAGGIIDISSLLTIASYETSLSATATTGTGGTINVSSYFGDVQLYQGTAGTNANINVSSTAGTGGSIHLTAAAGVQSSQDAGACCGNATIRADGATSGGSIIIASTSSSDVSLNAMSAISASATSGVGGNILLANFGTGAVATGSATLSANGSAGGGSVTAVSGGTIALSAINARATTTGPGGTIYLSSVGNLSAGALNASGSGARGGTVLISTAQPNPTATGTTLSQSGAATTPFASGTVTIGSFNVTGSSAGTASMYTSGNATITGGAGATTSQTKLVLPRRLALTAIYTLTPDLIPGGSFTSFSNTSTLTLSGFSSAPLPLVVSAQSAVLGTVTGAGQSFSVLSGGTISYASINTAPLVAGAGGSVALYSLSSAANTIQANGNFTTSGSGLGNKAGFIVIDAPFGNFSAANNVQILAQGNLLATANNISLLFGSNLVLAGGGGAINGATVRLVSTDGMVNANLLSLTGPVSGSAGTDFTLTVNSSALALGDISTRAGSITIDGNNGTGAITVGASKLLFANQGNLTIENDSLLLGTISIGANASLTALSNQIATFGNVNIVIGAVPASPVIGTAPANVTVSQSGGGQVFFGNNRIVANTPVNLATAIGTRIVFNTGTRPASAITLGGGVTITADPPGTALAPGSALIAAGGGSFAGFDATPNADPIAPPAPVIPTTSANGPIVVLNELIAGNATLGGPSRAVLQILQIPFNPALPLSTLNPCDTTLPDRPYQNSFSADEVSFGESTEAVNDNHKNETRGRKQDDESKTDHTSMQNEPSALKAIAFVQPAATATGTSVTKSSSNKVSAWVNQENGVTFDSPNSLILNSGEALIFSSAVSRIHCGEYSVSLRSGAIALVTKDGSLLKVRNLGGTGADSVSLLVHGRKIHVHPGSEAIMGPDDGSAEKVAQTDNLGRRRVTHVAPAKGKTIILSEFSMLSLIKSNRLLTQVVVQRPGKTESAVSRNVMKTMAALTYATAGHGQYSQSK